MREDELTFDNIVSDIDTYIEDIQDNNDNKDKQDKATEVDPDELFQEEPEGVGSDSKDQEDTEPNRDSSTSPTILSSIASALQEEGILSNLTEEDSKNVKTAEDLIELINKQIQSSLTDKQKRIDMALENNVDTEDIKYYEGTIEFLNKITEEDISKEDSESESLRKRLIIQDYLNRGYEFEEAEEKAAKSFDTGTDLKDAKKALENNKKFFNKEYEDIIDEARKKEESIKNKQKEMALDLQNRILNTEEPFSGLKLDKNTRKKIYENIAKPSIKEDGKYYTAFQKYKMENENEFWHKVGILFTLTDGFKTLDNLVKGKLNKEKKRSISELERKLANSRLTSTGQFNLMGEGKEDTESTFRLAL